jgi:Zn-dependent protease with chaperone function
VTPDTAGRNFSGLVVASFVGLMAIGAGACVLLSLLAYRISTQGVAFVTARNLWPALIFLVLVAGGAVTGMWKLRRQIVASARLSRRVRTLALHTPPALIEAARQAGLDGRVRLVDSQEAFSFAYGALSPRVAVSSGLLARLSPEELYAVLEHERYHVRNLDPLRVLFVRTLPTMLFYLPALRAFRIRYEAGRELAADRRALTACGRKPLAGALLKVVGGPGWGELQVAAAIGGSELLDVRLAQIEAGAEPRLAASSLATGLASLVGLSALLGSFTLAVTRFAGPLEVARAAMPGLQLTGPGLALGLLCVVPWAVAGYWAYRRLQHRARKPLDTTPV